MPHPGTQTSSGPPAIGSGDDSSEGQDPTQTDQDGELLHRDISPDDVEPSNSMKKTNRSDNDEEEEEVYEYTEAFEYVYEDEVNGEESPDPDWSFDSGDTLYSRFREWIHDAGGSDYSGKIQEADVHPYTSNYLFRWAEGRSDDMSSGSEDYESYSETCIQSSKHSSWHPSLNQSDESYSNKSTEARKLLRARKRHNRNCPRSLMTSRSFENPVIRQKIGVKPNATKGNTRNRFYPLTRINLKRMHTCFHGGHKQHQKTTLPEILPEEARKLIISYSLMSPVDKFRFHKDQPSSRKEWWSSLIDRDVCDPVKRALLAIPEKGQKKTYDVATSTDDIKHPTSASDPSSPGAWKSMNRIGQALEALAQGDDAEFLRLIDERAGVKFYDITSHYKAQDNIPQARIIRGEGIFPVGDGVCCYPPNRSESISLSSDEEAVPVTNTTPGERPPSAGEPPFLRCDLSEREALFNALKGAAPRHLPCVDPYHSHIPRFKPGRFRGFRKRTTQSDNYAESIDWESESERDPVEIWAQKDVSVGTSDLQASLITTATTTTTTATATTITSDDRPTWSDLLSTLMDPNVVKGLPRYLNPIGNERPCYPDPHTDGRKWRNRTTKPLGYVTPYGRLSAFQGVDWQTMDSTGHLEGTHQLVQDMHPRDGEIESKRKKEKTGKRPWEGSVLYHCIMHSLFPASPEMGRKLLRSKKTNSYLPILTTMDEANDRADQEFFVFAKNAGLPVLLHWGQADEDREGSVMGHRISKALERSAIQLLEEELYRHKLYRKMATKRWKSVQRALRQPDGENRLAVVDEDRASMKKIEVGDGVEDLDDCRYLPSTSSSYDPSSSHRGRKLRMGEFLMHFPLPPSILPTVGTNLSLPRDSISSLLKDELTIVTTLPQDQFDNCSREAKNPKVHPLVEKAMSSKELQKSRSSPKAGRPVGMRARANHRRRGGRR